LGWVSIGIGAVGLAVGGVTGAVMLSKKKDLDASPECENEACGIPEHDNVDQYNALRPVSTAGFIVGGVGLVGGLMLLVTAPSGEEMTSAQLSPWVGVGSVGVVGRF
jgi:hypothetical protein